MSINLLPCPFCGHESPEFERMGGRRQSCIVICGWCGARHESSDEGDRCGSSWNQRAEPGKDGLRTSLETALNRIEDMLADDDGQAFKEARKFLESARQLAEQPGFVMVPVEVVKFLTGEGPLDGLWFGEHPFGLGGGKYWWRKHLFAARPLPASPTAQPAEPVCDHSEGPWWATDGGVRNRGGYIVHTNSVQRYEGQDERYAREVAQREADKRLIAAAPDLLEALSRCRFDSLNMSLADLEFCRAAFIKATKDTQ